MSNFLKADFQKTRNNAGNLLDCVDSFQNEQIEGDFFPSYFGIEVTRHCNLACKMCPHPNFEKETKGHMNIDLFKKIIEKIKPYAETVKLHWVGEPLLNPSIVEMIRYARRQISTDIFMSTNCTMLTGSLADEVREAGLTKIILSVDGDSADSYENVRVKGKFSEVLKNVTSFLQEVESKGGPLCEVQMIQTHHNRSEIDDFKSRWSKFENVAVNVTWLTDWAGNITNSELISDVQNPGSTATRTPCSDLWFKMQVSWDGSVNLCCLDAFRTTTLGNLSNMEVDEIWQGEKIQKIRQQHLNRSYPSICGNCKDWARIQEYEFWYALEDYKKNPNMIWEKQKN